MSGWRHPLNLTAAVELQAGLVRKTERLVKQIFTGIVARTPVASGSLRASWRVSANVLDKSITFQKSHVNPLPPPVFRMPPFKFGDHIFVSNALPYVFMVEYGSSQKAPDGMVRVTLASVKV